MLKLDRFDVGILELLQADARLPTSRIATEIGLSASPTWGRLRRLQDAGVLRGYHGDIAIEKLMAVLQVIAVVTLENHRPQTFRRFEQWVAQTPNVIACWGVTGAADYVLQLIVPNIDTYRRLTEAAQETELGICRFQGHVVTKTVHRTAGLPISLLLKQASVEPDSAALPS